MILMISLVLWERRSCEKYFLGSPTSTNERTRLDERGAEEARTVSGSADSGCRKVMKPSPEFLTMASGFGQDCFSLDEKVENAVDAALIQEIFLGIPDAENLEPES